MVGSIISLLIGLALLMYAGDQFVTGASRLAKILRLSPVVVGAVILGFGTSAPELVISVLAVLRDDPALGVGNIVGSNVANLSLGLGLAAVITPVMCSRSLLSKEAAMSVGSTAIFALLVLDGNLVLYEGIVLTVLLVLAIITMIRSSDLVTAQITAPTEAEKPQPAGRNALRTILGLAGVLAGAQLAVVGATDIAEGLNLSKGFIGFSLVAVGTSLPEIATILAAARKGHTGLILGNLFGSNLFNSLAVSGAMGLARAGEIMDESLTRFGISVMVAVSLMAYGVAFTKGRVGRIEGTALLMLYAGAMVLLGVFG